MNAFYVIPLLTALAYYGGYRKGRKRIATSAEPEPESMEEAESLAQLTELEHDLLSQYRRGTFKLRTYAHPEYRFVVGIPKRFGEGKRSRRFFRTAVEAVEFIEQARMQIPESTGF